MIQTGCWPLLRIFAAVSLGPMGERWPHPSPRTSDFRCYGSSPRSASGLWESAGPPPPPNRDGVTVERPMRLLGRRAAVVKHALGAQPRVAADLVEKGKLVLPAYKGLPRRAIVQQNLDVHGIIMIAATNHQ